MDPILVVSRVEIVDRVSLVYLSHERSSLSCSCVALSPTPFLHIYIKSRRATKYYLPYSVPNLLSSLSATTMARQRRLRRTHPPVGPPKYSLNVLTWLLVAFFVLIGSFFFLSPLLKYNNRNGGADSQQQTSQKRLIYNSPDDISDALLQSLDAILVLGGGVPTSMDHPPVYVEKRCDDAIQLHQRRQQQLNPKKSNQNRELSRGRNGNNKPLSILCLSAGTAHVPQMLGQSDGLPVWESTACASYLAEQGNLSTMDIYVETTSYDTIGNAFYARTTHTDINGWRRLLIITNEFHMNRTQAIFDWIFGLDSTSTSRAAFAKKKKDLSDNMYRLYYLQSPNVGLSDEALQARREREAASAKTVREVLMPQYTTMSEVYTFLTQDHALYTAHKLVARGKGATTDNNSINAASEQVKKSYGGG